MFLNTFKIFLTLILLNTLAFANSVTFTLPDGWEKNEIYSAKNDVLIFSKTDETLPRETLTITSEEAKTSADKVLWDNFIVLSKKYSDFKYYKPIYTPQDSMGLGCSIEGSFCVVQRVEIYEGDIFTYTYVNSFPHYSQGLFGKWTNILGAIRAGKQEKTRESDEVFEI